MHFILQRFSLAKLQLNPWVKSEPKQLRQTRSWGFEIQKNRSLVYEI